MKRISPKTTLTHVSPIVQRDAHGNERIVDVYLTGYTETTFEKSRKYVRGAMSYQRRKASELLDVTCGGLKVPTAIGRWIDKDSDRAKSFNAHPVAKNQKGSPTDVGNTPHNIGRVDIDDLFPRRDAEQKTAVDVETALRIISALPADMRRATCGDLGFNADDLFIVDGDNWTPREETEEAETETETQTEETEQEATA